MKKVVIASLLAVASVVLFTRVAVAQDQGGSGASQGDTQVPQAEYNAFTNATSQTSPQAEASALESFLTTYPQSAIKSQVLVQLMLTYAKFDQAKALDASDRLLQVEPGNLRALALQVLFRRPDAEKLTDPTALQAAFAKIADYARKGLAAAKPASMAEADFDTLKKSLDPIFLSALGFDALNRKDMPAAIDFFKKELNSVPVAQTTQPGPVLQDTFYLGMAYMGSKPPDYVNCAYYVGRFVTYAPEPYKSQKTPTAKWCYKTFHGGDDGYDKVITVATANLFPPADFKVDPAPSPADVAKNIVATTPDLSTLAIVDKEYILQNGAPDVAGKVWDSIKGKSVQFPDVLVVAVSDTALQMAVTDNNIQTKTADFTFQLAEALKTPPAVGDKITVSGTYASYTPNPFMITMSDGAVVPPPKATPTRRPTARRR